MFRAGTSSRLKRLGLFRSCRWEASSKTQGLSEDASHHAREHKTPTEGTAHGIHRSVSQNQRFRHSGFFTLSLKGCCLSAEKVFGSTPFSKGVAGCRAGSPAKRTGLQGRVPCKECRTARREPSKKQHIPIKEAHFLKKALADYRKPCYNDTDFQEGGSGIR